MVEGLDKTLPATQRTGWGIGFHGFLLSINQTEGGTDAVKLQGLLLEDAAKPTLIPSKFVGE
jgi:hypothetical protein